MLSPALVSLTLYLRLDRPTDRLSFICRKAFYPIQKVTLVVSLPIERCLLPPTAFSLFQKETCTTKRRVLFCQAFHYRCQSNTQFSEDLDGIQEHFEIEFHRDINWCIIHIGDLRHVCVAPSMKRFSFWRQKWTGTFRWFHRRCNMASKSDFLYQKEYNQIWLYSLQSHLSKNTIWYTQKTMNTFKSCLKNVDCSDLLKICRIYLK